MDTVLSAHVTHKQTKMSNLQQLGELNSLSLLHRAAAIEGVRECVVLKTCNRVEVYVVTSEPGASRRGLEDLINGQVPFDVQENLVQYLTGLESIGHLVRVSCGLESMIVGEDQIQSQVKEAFEIAQAEGTVGPLLSVIFRKAISVGKKVRTETKVNKGCVSIGSAAVELAESKIGSLEGKNILVVGAGDVATLVAKHLVGKNPRTVFVSNRTYSRAVELAFVLGGKAVRFDSLIEFLKEADIVLCATSATHMVLTKNHLALAMVERQVGKRMVIIDVSFPRNVEQEVSQVEGVELYDLDGLRDVAEENVLRRKDEMKKAEKIIAQEIAEFEDRLREMRADELLGQLYSKFNRLKESELRKASCRLAAGNPPDEVLSDLASSLTNRFLADPTESLKEALRQGDPEIMALIQELFKIEGGPHVP